MIRLYEVDETDVAVVDVEEDRDKEKLPLEEAVCRDWFE